MQESIPNRRNMSESEKALHKRTAADAVRRLLKMERKIEEKVEEGLNREYDEFSQAAKAAIQTFGFGGITQIPLADNSTDDDKNDSSDDITEDVSDYYSEQASDNDKI